MASATLRALAAGAMFLLMSPAPAEQVLPNTIAVLPFEIEDNTLAQGGLSDMTAQQRRLELVADRVRRGQSARSRYSVVDTAPAAALIAEHRRLEALHACKGCELDIARALGARLVAVGWVQKVSNLIINVNLGIRDVDSGRMLLIRSVDLRGNTDEPWRRAADRLVRDVLDVDVAICLTRPDAAAPRLRQPIVELLRAAEMPLPAERLALKRGLAGDARELAGAPSDLVQPVEYAVGAKRPSVLGVDLVAVRIGPRASAPARPGAGSEVQGVGAHGATHMQWPAAALVEGDAIEAAPAEHAAFADLHDLADRLPAAVEQDRAGLRQLLGVGRPAQDRSGQAGRKCQNTVLLHDGSPKVCAAPSDGRRLPLAAASRCGAKFLVQRQARSRVRTPVWRA
jgi:hypothetical protein